MRQPNKYPIPYTRDPFVNTPLVPAGIDPETGNERFFITTWNACTGAVSALVDECGNSRIYRYKKGKGLAGCGAYSAVYTGNDTMWIVSDLAYPGKLNLKTGEYEFFESGAMSKLVFCGMQYDPNTEKFLAISCVHKEIQALSFDTKNNKTVKIYNDFTPASYSHGGFANADGKTYTMRLDTVYHAYYQWDPVAETLTEKLPLDASTPLCSGFIRDDEGKVYVPNTGWLDTSDYTLHEGPKPEKDMKIGRAHV